MSRAFEDAQELRYACLRKEHIAQQLGVSIEVLGDHIYELEEDSGDSAGNGGVIYGWRVLWNDKPPKGIAVHGQEGAQWSVIQAGAYDSDCDEEPRSACPS